MSQVDGIDDRDELRRAGPEDVGAMARIVYDWIRATDWMPVPPKLETLEEIFAAGLERREIWVIGAPVAGYLSLDRGKAQIQGLYCARRGAGLGRRLVDRVKQERDYLQLWTHAPNSAAHRFYEREGFARVEEKPEGRGDGVPEYRMEWRRDA